MNEKQSFRVLILSLISGILLLVSGTTGAAAWSRLGELVVVVVPLDLVKTLFVVLVFVASFGGIVVLLGGYALYKQNVWLGSLLITLGTGTGMVTIAFQLFFFFFTDTVGVGWFFSASTLGVLFGLTAKWYGHRGHSSLFQKLKKWWLRKH